MAEEKKQPEFYGETPMGQGQKVPHSAGRKARLEAAGIPEGESLAAFQKRRNAEAWAASGSQEDAGLEFQRVTSKQDRGAAPMTIAFKVEPPTESNVIGHSKAKKQAIALMKEEGISIQEALARVASDEAPKKSTRKPKKD